MCEWLKAMAAKQERSGVKVVKPEGEGKVKGKGKGEGELSK